MNYKLLLIVVIALIVLASMPETMFSARQEYRAEINRHGNLYILDVDMYLFNISSYGVVVVYLKPEGVYAYGLAVIKDPDKEYPDAYLMLGTQKNWYFLGEIRNIKNSFRLFVDANSSRAIAVLNSCEQHVYNVSHLPMLKQVFVSVFNITGREAPIPRVNFHELNVYVLNKTLDELRPYLCSPNLREIVENMGGEVIAVNETATNTTASTNTGSRGLNTNILLVAISSVIAVSIILVFLLGHRRTRWSPGP